MLTTPAPATWPAKTTTPAVTVDTGFTHDGRELHSPTTGQPSFSRRGKPFDDWA